MNYWTGSLNVFFTTMKYMAELARANARDLANSAGFRRINIPTAREYHNSETRYQGAPQISRYANYCICILVFSALSYYATFLELQLGFIGIYG